MSRQTVKVELAELQKEQSLSESERLELDELVAQAQHTMLHRAEARRLLAQRGHHTPTGLAVPG